MSTPKLATLCFLLEKDRILLGLKKRGFGVGKWNGVGGKVNAGETPRDAALRETRKEINIVPLDMKKVGVIRFIYESEGPQTIDVHVFTCHNWRGTPTESEEMLPKWFAMHEIPYDEMWPDDKIWLPLMLDEENVNGEFVFDDKTNIKRYKLQNSNLLGK